MSNPPNTNADKKPDASAADKQSPQQQGQTEKTGQQQGGAAPAPQKPNAPPSGSDAKR